MVTFNDNKYPFQVFGSASSLDLDICFFVDSIGSITENNLVIISLLELVNLATEKTINANLAIIEGGLVKECFKGTPDELNNALMVTYEFHTQLFDLQITQMQDRDVLLKVQRAVRTIISMFTRTSIRSSAKLALRSPLIEKIAFLEQLRIANFIEFGKNGQPTAVYKTIAFQIGQTLGLLKNHEFYTKESMSTYFPELHPFLFRLPSNIEALDLLLIKFTAEVKNYLTTHQL